MTEMHGMSGRDAVAAMDELLGRRFPVLDDGFVRVVDYLGSDHAIVQAARISYGSGTKTVQEDRGLIRYLMRHRHTTPFEMCEIKLHVRVPMDCWRQWIRHRTANVNEYSTRYSEAIDAMQATSPEAWRSQSTSNKQGSGGNLPLDVGQALSDRELELHQLSQDVYRERLDAGVAREQARKDLPLATYTEAYWKVDLHNLLHFLSLRMDSHAQQEIREYATIIGEHILSQWCPLTWEAFVDYRLHGTMFSRVEFAILRHLIAGKPNEATEVAIAAGLLDNTGASVQRSRERAELEQKLSQLGVGIAWGQ